VKRVPNSSSKRKGTARRRYSYRVEIPYVESGLIVDCRSPADALKRFMRERGIVSTDHVPRITRVTSA